jgi:hypothetical protein
MVWQPPQNDSPAVCSTIISVNTQEAKTSVGTNTSTAAPIFILRGEMAGLQYTRYACVSGVADTQTIAYTAGRANFRSWLLLIVAIRTQTSLPPAAAESVATRRPMLSWPPAGGGDHSVSGSRLR